MYQSMASGRSASTNADGYFQKNQYDALHTQQHHGGEDGSVAIQFGGCDGKIPNCLPTTSGWNRQLN